MGYKKMVNKMQITINFGVNNGAKIVTGITRNKTNSIKSRLGTNDM
jgi:hypothetical protein